MSIEIEKPFITAIGSVFFLCHVKAYETHSTNSKYSNTHTRYRIYKFKSNQITFVYGFWHSFAHIILIHRTWLIISTGVIWFSFVYSKRSPTIWFQAHAFVVYRDLIHFFFVLAVVISRTLFLAALLLICFSIQLGHISSSKKNIFANRAQAEICSNHNEC